MIDKIRPGSVVRLRGQSMKMTVNRVVEHDRYCECWWFDRENKLNKLALHVNQLELAEAESVCEQDIVDASARFPATSHVLLTGPGGESYLLPAGPLVVLSDKNGNFALIHNSDIEPMPVVETARDVQKLIAGFISSTYAEDAPAPISLSEDEQAFVQRVFP